MDQFSVRRSSTLRSRGPRVVTLKPPKMDIIWNLTRLCSWDCSICCVDAIQVRSEGGAINLRTDGLSRTDALAVDGHLSKFSAAAAWLQARARELTLDRKLAVLRNLADFDVKLDISGGDPLAVEENWTVLAAASAQLGVENITLTATGRGIPRGRVEKLAGLIGEFNFTYDPAVGENASNRPLGYAENNLRIGTILSRLGVRTRAELPLTVANSAHDQLVRIFVKLREAGIHRLLPMRLFPVGRGASHSSDTPSPRDYAAALVTLRDLQLRYGSPVVQPQCALKVLMPESSAGNNPCDLLSHSLGLMADGTLLLSPWAIGPHGAPLSEDWVIGNLADTPLSELMGQARLAELRSRLDENRGHCKIFAFIHSEEGPFLERILAQSDPLQAVPNHQS